MKEVPMTQIALMEVPTAAELAEAKATVTVRAWFEDKGLTPLLVKPPGYGKGWTAEFPLRREAMQALELAVRQLTDHSWEWADIRIGRAYGTGHEGAQRVTVNWH